MTAWAGRKPAGQLHQAQGAWSYQQRLGQTGRTGSHRGNALKSGLQGLCHIKNRVPAQRPDWLRQERDGSSLSYSSNPSSFWDPRFLWKIQR